MGNQTFYFDPLNLEAKNCLPYVDQQCSLSRFELDIVISNVEGINPKGIGLAAGQEDAKAASWATGALKKLLEKKLLVKEQLPGNKVIYKAI